MSKTYFEETEGHIGRGTAGDKFDPRKVVIAGLDKVPVAYTKEHAAALDECTKRGSNEELHVFLDNPQKFLTSYPDDARRVRMQNLLEGLATLGRTLKPTTMAVVGDRILVVDGRHNVAALRVLWDCVEGKRMVPSIHAAVEMIRARGKGLLPELLGLQPAKDATTGKAASLGYVADASQSVIVPGLRERFDDAMRVIRAHRAADKVPPWKMLAGRFGVSVGTVEGWEKLAEMDAQVIDDVFADRVPLGTAIAYKALAPEVQREKVAAQVAAGDTRASTARETAKAARRGEVPAGQTKPEKSNDAPAPKTDDLVRPKWNLAELKRYKAHAGDKCPFVVDVVIALMERGPDKIDATHLNGLPGLDAFLKAGRKGA